jgi:exopolyphosphatase/guanosine-5'-triphosphate,3'-diphosphate pyrophosphatase
MARTIEVLADYVERARRAGVPAPQIVATSAIRESANGRDFAREVLRRTGADVRIVSGEDEARLTVLGIVRGLGAVPGPLLAFDIGGGSTEFILAHDGQVQRAVSLRLGVVPLAERYPFRQAVDWAHYRALEDEVRGRLARELPAEIRSAPVTALVGTAGTVTALAALDLGLASYDATRVQGHRLGRETLEALLAGLGGLTVSERAALPCLGPGRADLIVPGTAIVLAALDVLRLPTVVVSDWGLREGIIAEAVGTASGRPFDSRFTPRLS